MNRQKCVVAVCISTVGNGVIVRPLRADERFAFSSGEKVVNEVSRMRLSRKGE